jgi:hypothetical protein
MTQRRKTSYDTQIPPDLWVRPVRVDLRLHLIEAVLTIARLHGATSLDVQEALSKRWKRPAQSSSIRDFLPDLVRYDLTHSTVQRIAGKQ